MPLTNKQQRFVEEYSVDSNATQAAIRAGYSQKTAAAIGEENLRKPDIATALRAIRKEVAESLHLTAQHVLEGLYREATAGNTGEPHSARVRAYELLGKHMGMFVERQEHGRPGDFAGLSEAELNSKIDTYMSSDTEH